MRRRIILIFAKKIEIFRFSKIFYSFWTRVDISLNFQIGHRFKQKLDQSESSEKYQPLSMEKEINFN